MTRTQHNGLWWPSHDRECRPAVLRTVTDAEPALALCREFRYCVQAGGNVGVWPLALAKRFDHVWTFEPEPDNFRSLLNNININGFANIKAENIALSDKEENLKLYMSKTSNAGTHSALIMRIR